MSYPTYRAYQPMSYCIQTDITNQEMTPAELVQLADDDKDGTADAALITAAIAKADAEIDAHCQNAYTVPFNPVPTIVKGWSATLSAFNLYRNRPKPSTLIDRYNKVMSWLASIRDGKARIPGVTVDSLSLPGSTTEGAVQTFTRTQYDADGNVVGTAGSMEVW